MITDIGLILTAIGLILIAPGIIAVAIAAIKEVRHDRRNSRL